MSKYTVHRAEILIEATKELTRSYIDSLFENLNPHLVFDPQLKNQYKIESKTISDSVFIPIKLSETNEFNSFLNQYKVYMGGGKNIKNTIQGYVDSKAKKIFIRINNIEVYLETSLNKIIVEYKSKLDKLREVIYTKLANANNRSSINFTEYTNSQIGKALSSLITKDVKDTLYPLIEEKFSIIVHELNHTYDELHNPEVFNNYIGSKYRAAYVSQIAEVVSIIYQTYYDSIFSLNESDMLFSVLSKKYFIKMFIKKEQYFISFWEESNNDGKKNYTTVLANLYNNYYNTKLDEIKEINFVKNVNIETPYIKGIDDLSLIITKEFNSYLSALSKVNRTSIVSKLIKALSISTKLEIKYVKTEVMNMIEKIGEVEPIKKVKSSKTKIPKNEKLSKDKIKDIAENIIEISKSEIEYYTKAINFEIMDKPKERHIIKEI